jgi:hypothetical protein
MVLEVTSFQRLGVSAGMDKGGRKFAARRRRELSKPELAQVGNSRLLRYPEARINAPPKKQGDGLWIAEHFPDER